MSRGPGCWQRVILQAVADGRAHYLADLLLPGYTRAEYNALNRASRRLEDAGRIVAYGISGRYRRTVIALPGTPRPRWDNATGGWDLSVGHAPSWHVSNT